MRINIFQIIVLFSVFVISQEINAQSTSDISIISSGIVFLRTETTKASTGPAHNGNASQVITYYKSDYYSLKLTIKINENIEDPLDIKLISPKGREQIYRLQQNIKLLWKDEFYDYNLEIILEGTGWYKFEIGDFSKNRNGINTNLVFDERNIYVKK